MEKTHINRYLFPEWPAPENIHAVVTTRECGNLVVSANRQRLHQDLALPQEPAWLNQVHGIGVVNLDDPDPAATGDAGYTQSVGKVCAILTADCLPIFLANRSGEEVAVVHAGWRGLLNGIIDAAVNTFKTPAADLLVWLGPAIGPDHFEVGIEVREQFINRHPNYSAGFYPATSHSWFADLYQLATINLQSLKVNAVYGGGLCTYCDPLRFYSYRREKGSAGRMASLIWITS